MTNSLESLPSVAPPAPPALSFLSVPGAAVSRAPTRSPHRASRLPKPAWSRKSLATLVLAAAVCGAGGARRLQPEAQASVVRHGSPTLKQTKNGHPLRWRDARVTVYLDASLARLDSTAGDAVVQAFGAWLGTGSSLPGLQFDSSPHTVVNPAQDGRSTVSYGPITIAGHEQDLALTVTYVNQQTGEILEADVVFNSLYPFAVMNTPAADPNATVDSHGGDDHAASGVCQHRYDLQNVATHEVGHFFGLGEDMRESHSTMFYTVDQCEVGKRGLSPTDSEAIVSLYASDEASEDGDASETRAGVVAACTTSPGRAAPASGAAAWILLGLAALRRRATAQR